MKSILESTLPPPRQTTEGLVKGLVLSYAVFAVADMQGGPLRTETYSFSGAATGPFTITPVSRAVVRIDQVLNFSSALPFPLSMGFVDGFDDLTIPTFRARFLNGTGFSQ